MELNDVQKAFVEALPVPFIPGEWNSFNCPSCGDQRGRGGFLLTDTGGFRYHCFNGGCDFQVQPTGWEEGRGLGGRPRKLLSLLGGDIKSIPIQSLLKTSDAYDRSGNLIEHAPRTEVKFDQVILPPLSVGIMEDIDDPNFHEVFQYAFSRLGYAITDQPLYWSPKYKRHLITAFSYMGENVGYMARNIDKRQYVSKSHPDFLFNQDLLNGNIKRMILVEGVFDAMMITGVAARKATPSKHQVQSLKNSAADIIVLPDFSSDGEGLVDVAEKNGWLVSTPDWDFHIKDVCDACMTYGRAYTIHSVVSSCHHNYLQARIRCRLK